MKRILSLLLAAVALLTISACGKTAPTDSGSYELESVLADNTLAALPDMAIRVTDVDGSLSAYYNEKQVESMVNGYYDGKPFSIINGYDTLWKCDFVFYLYNGSAYSTYSKYGDEVLKYADMTELEDIGDEYPSDQFYFLKNWAPAIADISEAGDTTTVVYEVTVQDDESFAKYFDGYYEGIEPGTKLYFEIELNAEGKITAYSLSTDTEGKNPVWSKFNYEYVPLANYNMAEIAAFDEAYDKQPLITVSLVNATTGETTAEIKIHKGSAFYAEISADEVLYLDRECTQPYLDYVLAYIAENGKQLAMEKDATYYIGAIK